jgi:hypothetical protein
VTQDLDRNRLIVETTMKYRNSGLTLILSERQQHCEAIGDLLKQRTSNVYVITDKTPAEQIQQIISEPQPPWGVGGRILVATNQIFGKGFDLPGIRTLVMATPGKISSGFSKNIKLAMRSRYWINSTVILNFSDDHEVFECSARSNWETYKQHGFTVIGSVENIRQISLFY